jgi:hypothetical protein
LVHVLDRLPASEGALAQLSEQNPNGIIDSNRRLKQDTDRATKDTVTADV